MSELIDGILILIIKTGGEEMNDVWKIRYNLHNIRIEKNLTSQKLYVDGVLQDEQIGFALSSRLFGKLKNEDGETEDIKVSISTSCFDSQCLIFVGEKMIYSTKVQWEG